MVIVIKYMIVLEVLGVTKTYKHHLMQQKVLEQQINTGIFQVQLQQDLLQQKVQMVEQMDMVIGMKVEEHM